MTLRFTWDPDKATANKRKHGVSFETAARVFFDPFALSEQDRIEGREYRWQMTGLAEGALVIVVAYTESEDDDDEVIRVISARRANRRERKRYEEEKYRHL